MRGRVQALDAVRAIALLLMIVGHVANYSFLWRTSHFAYFVWDGASIFMVVSGIVVAQVNRARIEKSGFGSAARRLARRAGFLYLVQFGLIALATATAYFLPSQTSEQFLIPGVTSWPEALMWALALGANPIYVNFLSSYVIILLAAIPALWLLSQRKFVVLMILAIVIYVAGLTWPRAFTLPNGPEGIANFNNATWFVLFLSGLVVGWLWGEGHVDSRLMQRRVVLAAGAVIVGLLIFVVWDALPPEPMYPVKELFNKDMMAPGRFVAAWAFFLVLYWLMRWLPESRWGSRVVEWLATVGMYPIDVIVILTLVTIACQGILGVDSSGRVAQVLALVTVVLAWLWARSRLQRKYPRMATPK